MFGFSEEFAFESFSTGSAGTLVGAALQTAGHSVQSALLDAFQTGAADSFGALMLIFAAIAALITIAMGGNYKFGGWFLIGSFLFYFLLFPRVSSKGVYFELVRRGSVNQLVMQSVTEGVTPDGWAETGESSLSGDAGNEVGKISWFFALYDRLVTDIVQGFVAGLNNVSRDADLTFINKVQRYDTLMNVQIEEPSLIAFIQLLFHANCSSYFGLMKDLYSPNQRFNSSEEMHQWLIERRDKLEQADSTYRINIGSNKDDGDYAVEFALEHGVLVDNEGVVFENVNQLSEAILARQVADGRFESEELTDGSQLWCRDVWWLLTNAVKNSAGKILTEVAWHNVDPGLALSPEERQRIRDLNLQKLQEKVVDRDRIRTYISHHSAQEADEDEDGGLSEEEKEELSVKITSENGCEFDEKGQAVYVVKEDQKQGGYYYEECIHEDQRILALINEIALRMIFREFGTISPNIVKDKHAPEPLWWQRDKARNALIDKDLREVFSTFEYDGKGTFFTAVLSLPYIQGLALYFLAIAYPFFALLIVLPGRHFGFMLWLGLWFWVKSWDIGIAVVQLIDEILYKLFPQGPPVTDGRLADPAEAIKILLETDPSYSVYTYYNILATLILAVPALMAILVKRGGQEVVHALVQGFQRFTGRIGHAMLHAQAAQRNQDLVEKAMKREAVSARFAMWQSLKDPDVYQHLGGSVILKALDATGSLKRDSDMSKIMKDVVSEYGSGAASDYQKQIGITKWRRNVDYARYNASMNLHNLALAHDTILNYYSNHDFVMKLPWERDIDVMKAEVGYKSGGATEKVMHNAAMNGLRTGAGAVIGGHQNLGKPK